MASKEGLIVKKAWIRMLSLMMVLSLTGAASAASIRLTNEPVTLTAAPMGSQTETKVALGDFAIAGTTEDGRYLISANGKLYTATAEAITAAVPAALSEGSVPAIAEIRTLEGGASGKPVITLQIALRTLGYYEGTADGNYNQKTAAAVTAFQEAMGLEATGIADGVTQALALAMAEEPREMEGNLDPEALFAPIIGKTETDLTPILESGLKMAYDDFSGEGFISDGTEITADLSGESELEKAVVTVRIGFLTRERGSMVEVVPAMRVSCLCVRRPMMNAVTVKAGEHRGSAEIGALSTRLDGIYTVEEGICELNEEMIRALAGAVEAGELKIRIGGQYSTFDLEVPTRLLASAAKTGAIALEME